MNNILVLGAGKSTTVLIDYLAKKCKEHNWKLSLADLSLETVQRRTKHHEDVVAKKLDVNNVQLRKELIKGSDVVVSMLPPAMHYHIAEDCLELGKHFFSASYTDKRLKEKAEEIQNKGLFFLNECGLDPGLDHMSAMKIIQREQEAGNHISLFKSFCGGLLSPKHAGENPWNYKFTWNPRNVVVAGKGVSTFIRNGYYKFIPYHMLFKRTESVDFPKLGSFEAYPNRDSLSYRSIYGLDSIPTILRGTLRNKGFCRAWNILVMLGLTDDSFELDLPEGFSCQMLTNAFLPYDPQMTPQQKIKQLIPDLDKENLEKLAWLGMFSTEKLPKRTGTPAEILLAILEQKWKMNPEDRDMVLMQHQFTVVGGGKSRSIYSDLTVMGDDQEYTAMAKTVGYPLGAAVYLFMKGQFKTRGILLPILKEIYAPILEEVAKFGIEFQERTLDA
ncbi:saccharopine dehydrogenase family protein [Pleomorphovibrio marinus]|uniref:saccharopine dehydrogenase family protein n=1 Tax=Pleomorphovibrio marinus TaxID=2164132 RepID=UPI000E0A8E6F|nr:saccharopine dehydrogenase C-terminal domain-containing protein [Pleomorphovibrio marinus]